MLAFKCILCHLSLSPLEYIRLIILNHENFINIILIMIITLFINIQIIKIVYLLSSHRVTFACEQQPPVRTMVSPSGIPHATPACPCRSNVKLPAPWQCVRNIDKEFNVRSICSFVSTCNVISTCNVVSTCSVVSRLAQTVAIWQAACEDQQNF